MKQADNIFIVLSDMTTRRLKGEMDAEDEQVWEFFDEMVMVPILEFEKFKSCFLENIGDDPISKNFISVVEIKRQKIAEYINRL